MNELNDLANAIYAPRRPGRMKNIRHAFEMYQKSLSEYDDPRPKALHVLMAGMGTVAIITIPIIMYLV